MAEKNTIKIDYPTEDLSSAQPSDFVPESKKTREWFEQWARYICTFYNPPAYSFDLNGEQNTNSGTDARNWNMRLADEMINNLSYLMGQQPNINYRYLEQDATGRVFGNPWIKGRNAGKIVDFAHGELIGSLENITFDAVSLSKDVITKKNKLFEDIKFAFQIKDKLPEGVQYKPYNKDFDMEEDIEEEKINFKDELEDIAIDLTEDIFTRENLKWKYADIYLDVLCGMGAIYNYVSNGKIKKRHIESFNCIWDNRRNSQFGEGMRFWGFVEYNTPVDWVAKCPELADIPNAVNELYAIGNNAVENIAGFMQFYNNGWDNGLQWYNDINGKRMIAGVTGFFIAPRDLKFIKSTKDGKRLYAKEDGSLFFRDDIGNVTSYKGKTYIKKQEGSQTIEQNEKYQDEKGDFLTLAVHKFQMIGNRWCTNFGYEKNILRNYNNPGEPVPNMSFFIPNMKLGQPRPVMGIIKKNQDEIDRLSKVLRDLQGRDYGKIPIVNAAIMGESGKDAVAFSDDLKNEGVLVARTSAEFLQLTRDLRAVEVIDLSNNSNLISYLELKREEERQMEEFVGLSKNSLGTQDKYISGQVQNQSANYSSNIMKNTVDGFMEFMRRDLQHSMNIQKMLDGRGKNKDAEMVLGANGLKLVKITKERSFESMLLYIKIQDNVDQATRQRILAYAQAWSQNIEYGIDPSDILMLEQEKSLSQMIRKLQRSIKRNKMDKQKEFAYQQQIQSMQQMQIQQQQAASQAQIESKKAIDKLTEKLETINLQGAWKIKEAEVTNKLDTAFVADEAIIQNAMSKVFAEPPAEAAAPQEAAVE